MVASEGIIIMLMVVMTVRRSIMIVAFLLVGKGLGKGLLMRVMLMLLMRVGKVRIGICSIISIIVAAMSIVTVGITRMLLLLLLILKLISTLMLLSTIIHTNIVIISVFPHPIHIRPEPFAKPADLLKDLLAAGHLVIVNCSDVIAAAISPR